MLVHDNRHHGSGVPEYWGRDSPYHGGTEFLGTPPNHLEVRVCGFTGWCATPHNPPPRLRGSCTKMCNKLSVCFMLSATVVAPTE